MLAGFVFWGAVLEVVLRIAGYGNLEIYDPDPILYWRLKPNQNCFTKIDRKPVHINSLGTRGPEFSPAKPPGTLRLISFGDSKTFGWGLTEDESYSGVLREMLQAHVGASRKVEIINAGVNAYSYPQMHLYLRNIALQYQPDIVLLADANLWTQFSEDNSPEFVQSFMRRVRLKNLLRRFATYHYVVEYKLQKVYERTRTKFIPIDPKTDALFKEQQKQDPDAFFRRHIEGFCHVAISNRVQPVLIFIPTLDELKGTNVATGLRAKRQVSREIGVPLVDLSDELKPQGQSLYLDADPVHLNVEGNRIIARKVFNSLTNLISR